jgi:hypothetical protein
MASKQESKKTKAEAVEMKRQRKAVKMSKTEREGKVREGKGREGGDASSFSERCNRQRGQRERERESVCVREREGGGGVEREGDVSVRTWAWE